jgi:hypothetical protein
VPAIPDQPGLEKSNGQISSQPFITNYGYIWILIINIKNKIILSVAHWSKKPVQIFQHWSYVKLTVNFHKIFYWWLQHVWFIILFKFHYFIHLCCVINYKKNQSIVIYFFLLSELHSKH